MAHAYTTTADLLQLGDGNISDIDVSQLLEETPFLSVLPAGEASDTTSHSWLKKITAPTSRTRALNEGVENTKAVYSKVEIDLAIYDCSSTIDLAAMKTSAGEALKLREARDHLRAAFVGMEQAILAAFAAEESVDKKDDAMVIDATGTTANGTTSVWAVRASEEGVSAIYGGNGRIEIGEEYQTTISDANGKVHDAIRTPIVFWGGTQIATSLDLARICNLTKQSGKTLDDDMLSDLVHLFPAGRGPTHLIMSRQSRKQLQQSRDATSPTGAAAPTPTHYEDIPIIVTDSVSDTDAVVAATA